MSVRKLLGILFLGLLFTASAAAAADIVNFHFINTGGITLGGVPVYPYYAEVNGDPVTVACDDFYHQSNPGDTYDAYRTYLISGDVSNTRFHDFQLYQEIAWLAGQFLTASPSDYGTINWAVWEMTSPGLQFPNDPGEQQLIDGWILSALQNYLNGPSFWKELVIYTPVNAPDQEMIGVNGTTPEPGTLLMLGSGIVGLWSQRKRIF